MKGYKGWESNWQGFPSDRRDSIRLLWWTSTGRVDQSRGDSPRTRPRTECVRQEGPGKRRRQACLLKCVCRCPGIHLTSGQFNPAPWADLILDRTPMNLPLNLDLNSVIIKAPHSSALPCRPRTSNTVAGFWLPVVQ